MKKQKKKLASDPTANHSNHEEGGGMLIPDSKMSNDVIPLGVCIADSRNIWYLRNLNAILPWKDILVHNKKTVKVDSCFWRITTPFEQRSLVSWNSLYNKTASPVFRQPWIEEM
jgi:hypothetical protein